MTTNSPIELWNALRPLRELHHRPGMDRTPERAENSSSLALLEVRLHF